MVEGAQGTADAARRPEPVTSPAPPPVQAPLARDRGRGLRFGRRGQLVRADQQGQQVVAVAGSAVVTAARVGRLLGRTGWRLARQLPGVDVVEEQANRLRAAAGAELLRLLELPPRGGVPATGHTTSEEARALLLVQDGAGDPEPLRTAMTELLDRSTDPDRTRSRDYLFGTIVSQLVPDEARILATLARHDHVAAVDVVTKPLGRSGGRVLLGNVSTVGATAGIASPADTGTHLLRLEQLGLVETDTSGTESSDLASQYDVLENDDAVRAARTDGDRARRGGTRVVRKTVRLTPLGRDFWAATAPTGVQLARRAD